MPNKVVKELMVEVEYLKKVLSEHLLESGYIKSNLKWNTWLTGGIAMAVLTRAFLDYIKK